MAFVEPGLEIGVVQEAFLRANIHDDIAKDRITLGDAQVTVLRVVAFEFGPNVELEVRPVLIVDKVAFVEPGLEIGVVQEIFLRANITDGAAQVRVTLRDAQVTVLLVVAFQLGPNLGHLASGPCHDRVPHDTSVALPASREIERLLQLLIHVAKNASVCIDRAHLLLVHPGKRVDNVDKASRLDDLDDPVIIVGVEPPQCVQSLLLWIPNCVVLVLPSSYLECPLRLSEIRAPFQRMVKRGIKRPRIDVCNDCIDLGPRWYIE